jgi:hypothetical protein
LSTYSTIRTWKCRISIMTIHSVRNIDLLFSGRWNPIRNRSPHVFWLGGAYRFVAVDPSHAVHINRGYIGAHQPMFVVLIVPSQTLNAGSIPWALKREKAPRRHHRQHRRCRCTPMTSSSNTAQGESLLTSPGGEVNRQFWNLTKLVAELELTKPDSLVLSGS